MKTAFTVLTYRYSESHYMKRPWVWYLTRISVEYFSVCWQPWSHRLAKTFVLWKDEFKVGREDYIYYVEYRNIT